MGRRKWVIGVVVVAAVMGICASAHARFDLVDYSAKATGRGGAFVATADDGSAMYYNAAGLSRIEGNLVEANLMTLLRYAKYESLDGEKDKINQTILLPSVFLVLDTWQDDLKWGLGAYVPFGTATDWGEDSPLRYASTFAELRTYVINSSVSYKANDDVSVGFGLNLYSGKATTRKKIDFGSLLGSPGDFDGEFELESDEAYAVGFNVGALWNVSEQWRVGISYRSAFDLKFKGNATITDIPVLGFPPFTDATDASKGKATYKLPDIFMIGAAYDVNEKLNLGADFQWTNWSRFSGYVLDFDPETLLLTDEQVETNYKDAFIYKLGGEYALSETMFFRFGAAYTSESVPAKTLAADPSNPSNRRYSGYLGWGYKDEAFHLNLSLALTRFSDRSVDMGDGYPANGKYKTMVPQFGIGAGWAF